MLVTLVRALILYVLIIICMRIMGKRQLGELQPTELVITILLSEIAAIPMQDNALRYLRCTLCDCRNERTAQRYAKARKGDRHGGNG